MSIHVELIKENRVILQTYTDPLDSNQINELRDQMDQEILPAALGKTPIIADFRGVKNLPGTILTTGTSMLKNSHSNTGMIIFVTTSAFVDAMARVFMKLAAKQPFKVVKSLDEAFAETEALLRRDVDAILPSD